MTKPENQNKTSCKSCGDRITLDQGIMTTLGGAYHKDVPECSSEGLALAPAPRTLSGL